MEDEELARIAGFVATGRANIAYEGRGDLPSAIALNCRALQLLANDEQGSAPGIAANNLVERLLDIGDLPAARVAIDEAIRISRAHDHPAEIAGSLCMMGRLQAIQGRLSEAMKTYERVLRLTAEYDEAGLLREAGEARVVIGGLLFERNDLEAATRYLLEGIELALEWVGLGEATSRLLEDAGTHDRLEKLDAVDADSAQSVVPGYIGLARVRYAQWDTEGAFETLQMVEQVARNSRVSPLRRNCTEIWVEAWRARLQIAEGNLGAADRWARERRLSAQDEPEYSPESEYLTPARLLIARGKHEEASSLLQWLLEDAEAGGRGRTVIEVLVLKALALRAQNNEPGALAALRRALVLAEPEGCVRTIAGEGAPMIALLRRVLRANNREPQEVAGDVSPEYTGELLEALGAEVAMPARSRARGTEQLVSDPITERELEVLKLLDSNLSNREIAARLFVSLATIKSHTKHLYAKLGVSARHQAVARGKELGLL
jgi:LuxR family transcriptional regulator, maltose regulon positive regulatory protein